MSYPEPRYLGDGGEVSATIRRAIDPPDLVAGSRAVHYLATGSSTHGLFGLYRWEMDGSPGGARPHFHRSFTESFYVLSGEVRLYDGADWTTGRPGDFMFVPEGGVHGFGNESGEPASMLILFAPGASREAYFEALDKVADLPPDDRRAFFVEHDNIWV